MNRQLNKKELEIIWKFSNDYLESLAKNAQVDFKQYLEPSKPKNMNDVMQQFASSLQNTGRLTKIINFKERELKFKEILCNFNPKEIVKKLKEQKIYSKLKNKFQTRGSTKTWKNYAKYIYSAATFLNQFNDIKDFNNFLKKFSYNTYTKAALPMLLAKEINGFGFALACDCIKELGLNYYPKPDTHIIKILKELGQIEQENQYLAYKALIDISQNINKSAYSFDKILWLNCTGRFYNEKPVRKAKTTRKKFLKELKKELKRK